MIVLMDWKMENFKFQKFYDKNLFLNKFLNKLLIRAY